VTMWCVSAARQVMAPWCTCSSLGPILVSLACTR
jgi:hypothetical protein